MSDCTEVPVITALVNKISIQFCVSFFLSSFTVGKGIPITLIEYIHLLSALLVIYSITGQSLLRLVRVQL
jgi:hypothetical protein